MSELFKEFPFEQLSRMVGNIDRFDHHYVDHTIENAVQKKEEETEEKLKEVSDKIIEDGI
ncbi:MAG: hypothetical protein MJZ34_07490 [Paludibacteraceae bacterium]|nr:hypothetical protein [Paludibacteraceae bacterium]